MPQNKTNKFLSLVMRHLRANRSLGEREEWGYFIERTIYQGKPYKLPLYWFVTKGCINDKAGGCTMCNFGQGRVTEKDIIWQVEKIVEQLNKESSPLVYITPLGSMFDDAEVPPSTREKILRLIAQTDCKIFGTESRADTITEEKMQQFRSVFGSATVLQVGIGLESANDYVRRNCLNKRMTKQEFLNALHILSKYNIQAMVHVLLKPPFLTEYEAIQDAVHSIKWAFEQGAQRVVFFMSNIKPYTLIHWLFQRGLYRVPWLWSGVKVLLSLPEEMRRRITISGIYSGIPILRLPHNCEHCSAYFVRQLQKFSSTLNTEILHELDSHPCKCRREWEQSLGKPQTSLKERLVYYYREIAINMFGKDWWEQNKSWILKEIV